MKKNLWRLAIFVYGALGWFISRCTSAHSNKVVINCNQGLGYLCNPKYIVEAMERLYPGQYRFFVLVKEKREDIPAYVNQVGYYSITAIYHLATARFWISNARALKLVPKRCDQFYVQTWHASITPKIVERDAGNKLPERYQLMARIDGEQTDLMFADNDFMKRQFERAFWFEGPVLRCGVPRNRPYLNEIPGLREKVLTSLGIGPERRIVTYAPTFRNDYSLEPYSIDPEACCDALDQRFGGRFEFVWRLHPNFTRHGVPDMAKTPRSHDGTGYFDAQELIAVSDVLISDYSSTIDDFVFTDRPAFMFATDVDSYLDERGFYYPLTDRPYGLATCMEELIALIGGYDFDRAEHLRCEYFKRFDIEDDGRGDETIAKLLNSLRHPESDLYEYIEVRGDGAYQLTDGLKLANKAES